MKSYLYGNITYKQSYRYVDKLPEITTQHTREHSACLPIKWQGDENVLAKNTPIIPKTKGMRTHYTSKVEDHVYISILETYLREYDEKWSGRCL